MLYTNLKRGLSLLLVLVMTFSMVPFPVFAGEVETVATELQSTSATESTVVPEEIPAETTISTVSEPEETLMPILVTELISLTVLEEESASPEIQDRMDTILNQYGITSEMTDSDMVNAIVVADGDTIKATMDEIAAIESEAGHLSEEAFRELNTELYGRFCGVFSALFNPSPIAAKTNLVLDGKVSVTDDLGNGALSGSTITITAKGSLFSKKTNTITITNETSDTATVSFDYTVTSANSFTIAGSTVDGTKYSAILDGGSSVTIVLTSNSGLSNTTATLKLSNFSYTVAQTSSEVKIEYDGTKGSVTVNGTAVNSGYSQNVDLGTSLTLATTAKTGYRFLGWTDKATGERLSSAASYAHEPAKDITIVPIFVATASDTAWFLAGNTHLFNDLNAAVAHASAATTKTVILQNNGTLAAGDYNVLAGVTLLIPFDAAGTIYRSAPEAVTSYTTPSPYFTLTMASGAKITVNGEMSVSGKHCANMGSNGMPTGKQGYVVMEEGSSITVNGTLYAWGYIVSEKRTSTTEAPKSGIVTVNGTVYECFQIKDYRGGDGTSSMAKGSNPGGTKVFPMSQYYVQNVQVPMTLNKGATEGGYMSVDVSIIGIKHSPVPFIGSKGMFRITEGSITKDYDELTDRLNIDINGTLEMAAMSIDIQTGIFDVTINSSDFVLPVTSNMTVTVKSGSTVYAKQDLAFIPGCKIIIEENAVFNVGVDVASHIIYIYDSDQWGGYCYSKNLVFCPLDYAYDRVAKRAESSLVDAEFLVNGTIDGTYGYIYTTESGANVYSTANGKVISKAGSDTVTYQATQATVNDNQQITYVEIPITPAQLKNADGSFTKTATATAPTTYTYTNGKWNDGSCEHPNTTTTEENRVEATCYQPGSYTEVVTCNDCGKTIRSESKTISATGNHIYSTSWSFDGTNHYHACTTTGCTAKKDTAAHDYDNACDTTCNTCGSTRTTTHAWVAADCDTPKTCSICGTTEGAAAGHSYTSQVTTAATCTAPGVKTYTCSKCGDSYTEAISALGHDLKDMPGKEATCTEDGYTAYKDCSRCDYIEGKTTIPSQGHTEVIDAAVAATCTTAGKTEGKHCSVCNTVIVAQTEVAALGHTEVTDAAVAPTCTEPGKTEGKHCSACKTVLVAQTEVPALGHKMVSNNDAVLPTYQQTGMTASQTCSVCGETTPGTVDPKVVQLNAFAASAAEEVYLEMKFFLPEEMANGTITLTHTVTKNGNTTTDNESYNVADLTPDANGRYVITHGIASGEMTCPVIVSFKTAGGKVINVRKGSTVSEFASCAVTDYAELVLTKGNENQKKLITNLLTYGGYAQALFNVDASNPAYNLLSTHGVTKPNLDEVTASSISNVAAGSGPAIGIQKGTQEAFLDSAIYHRVYFTLDAGNTIDNFKFVLTYPVNKVEYTKELTPVFESGKDRYYVEIEDIPAAYLDYDYKISVTNKNTGETYTVTTSVLAYLKALLNSETATTEQKNLAKAMYLYNQQANTFFGK